MSILKRNCTSEAPVSCPECGKRGRSRVIKKHVLEHLQFKGAEYRCVLPAGDGICEWSCGKMLRCFNVHQKTVHGICFDDGASHVYTGDTGFLLKGVSHANNYHSAMCLAGSRVQAEFVMKAGRERYRLRNDKSGFKVIDFSTAEKVLINGRWYLPDKTTEIICREDGRYVIRGGGKIKVETKPVNPEKKNNNEHYSVSKAILSDLFFEGEIPRSVGKVINVSLPVVYLKKLVLAKAVPETNKATTEMLEETVGHVGLVVTNDDAFDNEDGDKEATSCDLMEASSLLLGIDSFIYIEDEIAPQSAATARSLIHTKIPDARAAILMHKSKIEMHSAEIVRLEGEIEYWELVTNSYKE